MEANPEEQTESRSKRVFKILSVYAVTGWLITQVVTTVAPYIDLPAWFVKAFIILVVSGFPVAALYGFFFKRNYAKTRSVLLLSLGGFFAVGITALISQITSNANETRHSSLREKSIAVLPFVDLSQNKDQEYFSDGLTEELLNMLAKTNDLKVIARTSSFYFKGKNEDMRIIGQKLGVAHVLEGSVRKSGNKLRITAQLINANDGTHLWSETYDRTLNDIFEVQDDIASAVVSHLKVSLLSPSAGNQNPEAYNLYLEGKYFTNKRDKESSFQAVEKYKKALEIDPKYAMAWAGLAMSYSYQATNGFISTASGQELALEAIQRALQIDSTLSDAFAMQSRIFSTYYWDWEKADSLIKKAIGYGAGNALALSNAGILATHLGRFEEAFSLFKKSTDIDPLRTATFYGWGLSYYYAGKWSEAEIAFRKTLELNQAFAGVNYQLARVQLMQGKYDSALHTVMRETDESWRLDGLPLVYFKLKLIYKSDSVLDRGISRYSDGSAYQIAEIYAYRGEIDKAFQWLERAYQLRDAGLANVNVEPMLNSLHNDTRWRPFLVKMKLAKK